MGQEERLLFPYLDTELTEVQDDKLLAQFESIDRGFDEMPDAQRLHEAKEIFLKKYTPLPQGSVNVS